jgi:hypothetical protein
LSGSLLKLILTFSIGGGKHEEIWICEAFAGWISKVISQLFRETMPFAFVDSIIIHDISAMF